MADSYWIWSHGFKIYEDVPERSPRQYTLEELDAMTHMEQISTVIGRWSHNPDFDVERMAYIIKHGMEHERTVIGHKLFSGNILKMQYTRVLMNASRAVEFKMRFHDVTLDGIADD